MRNRIRHEVIPLLKERINPQVKAALLRMSDVVQLDEEVLSIASDRAYQSSLIQGEDRGMGLDVLSLQALTKGLQYRVIKKWLIANAVPNNMLEMERVEQIHSLIQSSSGTQYIDLSTDHMAVREYTRLFIQQKKRDKGVAGYFQSLAIPGKNLYSRCELVRLRKGIHRNVTPT